MLPARSIIIVFGPITDPDWIGRIDSIAAETGGEAGAINAEVLRECLRGAMLSSGGEKSLFDKVVSATLGEPVLTHDAEVVVLERNGMRNAALRLPTGSIRTRSGESPDRGMPDTKLGELLGSTLSLLFRASCATVVEE